jgi:hypothetical protein
MNWLKRELEKDYMLAVRKEVEEARRERGVMPEAADVFKPLFRLMPWEVRLVIVVSEWGAIVPECDVEFVQSEVMRTKWPEIRGRREKIFRGADYIEWVIGGALVIPARWASVGEWEVFTDRVIKMVGRESWRVDKRSRLEVGEVFGWYTGVK